MKTRWSVPILACLLSASIHTAKTNGQDVISVADARFRAGQFDEADKLYRPMLAKDTSNYRATVRLGHLALLSNRLTEAQKWLKKSLQTKKDDVRAKRLLAEVFYRQDDFERAASLLRTAGNHAVAKKLESFRGATPYEIHGDSQSAVLKFVVTDPLPLVRVRVNDSEEVNFLIDTGGAELIIDKDFGKEVGANTFGSAQGTFAGGKKATFEHGRIDSLTLGGFLIKNLPVNIMNTRQFSKPVFGGRRVDGIIGTVLLYHFYSTLDYPRGRLVLRRKTPQNAQAIEAMASDSITMPFWMAGDHYMVAWGTVNMSDPVLFFVDTGLAGGGFTCAKSVIDEAGIKLDEKQAGAGIGGGGNVRVVPFMVKELTLGDAKERNIRGLFLGNFPLENAFGFRIGGRISHGFLRPYALTFDFEKMRLILERDSSER